MTQELIVQQEFATAGDGTLPHHLQHPGCGDNPPRVAHLGGKVWSQVYMNLNDLCRLRTDIY